MNYDFSGFKIVASGETELKAASLLADEAERRTSIRPEITDKKPSDKYIELVIKEKGENEDFTVEHSDTRVTVTACRLRSLVYGFGLFIRKSEIHDGAFMLTCNISGEYSPSMPIRGHQLSYTDMNNTLDAWTREQFRQYFIDLMLFGNNTVECDPGEDIKENRHMKYTCREAMQFTAEICDELDLDLSSWHPLSKNKSDEETLAELRECYEPLCKLDVLFPPGGDPGDMEPEDFVERCVKMKREMQKIFPNIKMFPSAQAPHECPDWGERFVKKMAELPEDIDGVIYGPNHALPLDELRRRIDGRYPFRFYPDIGHNVRCETPVHFPRDDWHYALAATLSREAVNPRPSEYRQLHRNTRQYFLGSVTYSEGVNDDLNKFVWSAMDFDFNCEMRESVRDYVRAFFPGVDVEKLTDMLLAFEQNWIGDPAENPTINAVFDDFCRLEKQIPALSDNWRFVMHLFRAYCDSIVRDRRVFELGLISEAKCQAFKGDVAGALETLKTELPAEYKEKRDRLFPLAERLYDLIGMQLDVEHFSGLSWERGCTLDTIDNPVTDRLWLIGKLENDPENAMKYFERNRVGHDELYFSFAEHGFDVCGTQEGEFYMNFQGDRNGNAALPMCMVKVYDHFNFKTNVSGLTGGDYKLRITYKERPNDKITHHKLTVNGYVIHDGGQFGGVRDVDFEKQYLADGYQSVVYDIPAEIFEKGCATLEITEPLDGFMISEFWFVKAR